MGTLTKTAEGQQEEKECQGIISKNDIEQIAQKAAKEAIKEYKKEKEKERKKEKYHNTFKLMKCYRDAVFHVENAISDGEQIGLKEISEERKRIYLESVRKSRFKTMVMIEHIDRAIEEMKRRRAAAGREAEYKAFEMYFMEGLDYAQIAERLETGNSTPRRWITAIINELSILLWGIDEERIR